MSVRKYLVTNDGEGSICITGRERIEIPGMCKDMVLALPEKTARQTAARLKQRYPLLKIVEIIQPVAGKSSAVKSPAAEAEKAVSTQIEAGSVESKGKDAPGAKDAQTAKKGKQGA